MPSSTRKDPISNCRYQVEIDGIIQAGFSEVIMPESMSNVIEYREGTDPLRIRKLPGLTLYSNLILKYGVTDAMALYNWRKSVEQGKMSDARRNLAVILLDEEAIGNQVLPFLPLTDPSNSNARPSAPNLAPDNSNSTGEGE